MQARIIQVVGFVLTLSYAVFIVWLYATEPRSLKEVTTSAEVATGAYQVNQEKFNAGTRPLPA